MFLEVKLARLVEMNPQPWVNQLEQTNKSCWKSLEIWIFFCSRCLALMCQNINPDTKKKHFWQTQLLFCGSRYICHWEIYHPFLQLAIARELARVSNIQLIRCNLAVSYKLDTQRKCYETWIIGNYKSWGPLGPDFYVVCGPSGRLFALRAY